MATAVAKPPDEGIGGMPKLMSPGLPSVPSRTFIRVANTLLLSFIRVANTLLVSFIHLFVLLIHYLYHLFVLLIHYL
jgi:hypothetical protein